MYLLILETEEGGENEREKNLCKRKTLISLPHEHARTEDWTHNLGMRPDQESNLQHLGAQDNAPTNWTTWLGPDTTF